MFNFLNKLFGGDKSQKDVKKLQPQVDAINDFFNQYEQLSNDELRQNTTLFKTRIAEALSEIDAEIVNINESIKSLPSEDLAQMEATYEQLDNLQQERLKQLEIVLEEILPEAFATIKEAARRFSASSEIISQATEMDKALAISKNYVSIKNNQAIFKNTWVAAGSTVVWNMVHYDVQLVGGIALHQGKISEMSTGEGKTLVSTLPAYLNALSGKGVHIVTVNDYLARRDSEWNGPLLEWLGITVDCIDKYDPHSEKRHQAYLADITYGTNNEFGFDYLRDNMVIHATDKVQRKHHFAMVDEVDSVLIDDARTPLIISGPISHASNEQQFFEFKPLIETLLEAQRKIFQFSLQEAKRLIAAGIDDPKESGFHLFRAFRGLPKNTALIKFLSETNVRQKLQKAENYYLSDQQKEMHKIDADLYFYIDEKNNSIELTDKGLHLIGQKTSNPNFFTIPDLGIEFGKLEQQTELTPAEIKQKKEVLMTEYSVKAENIHCVNQLLKAFTLFEKDVDYIVLNEQIKIIDEQTGRILEGRRYSDGLHQALEAKENVKIEASTQTYATITLQNYFRMYHKVAGMTGTAETEAQEFWDIYKLDVMKIPTNVPMIRIDQNDQIFKTKREKYKAIIEYVQKLSEKGQPILIGTTSVEVSELLSKILSQSKIKHNVLNAKQHAREAQVIAEAGLKNAVTIATNMAGRGTDIKLGEGVKEIGGLAILGTEKHESRRVDRQLRGRSGRQGDPGSTLFMMSLEDNLIRMFGGERIAKVADFAGFKEGEVIEHKLITNAIERAQKKVEENNYGIRKRLLEYDDVMNKQRNVIYKKRDAALFGERIKLDIDNAFYLVATLLIQKHLVNKNYNEFILEVILNFEFEINKTISQTHFENEDENILIQKLYQAAIHNYNLKKQDISNNSLQLLKNVAQHNPNLERVVMPITNGRLILNIPIIYKEANDSKGITISNEIEKIVFLHFIDDLWKEHLRLMDDLKHSVQTATYEQKDPLLIYKIEAFELFNNFNQQLSQKVSQFLSHIEIYHQPNEQPLRPKLDRDNIQKKEKLIESRNELNSGNAPETNNESKQEPIKAGPKIGRNDPCPCGSEKKYKNCHG